MTEAGPSPLRRLWTLYLPLALSFEMMLLDGPSVQWAIGRLPDPKTNLAGWGLTMQLALLIESPIIMLLSTATALVHHRQAFRALHGFMLQLSALCTVVAAVVAFTPMLDIVAAGWLGQPTPIVAASRLPLQIMLLWSGAIGWRRFYQGVLVRQGETRLVTVGTALRLTTIILPALGLVVWGKLTGAATAATAIMVGVLLEAVAATYFAKPIVRHLPAPPADEPPLTTRKMLAFHLPLAATTLLTLLAGPITSAALARLPYATQSLAAWPVVFSALMVLRGWGFAAQEITVAQLKQGTTPLPLLRRFVWWIGVITSLLAVLLARTPLIGLYSHALGVPADLHPMVADGVLYGALLPLLAAVGALVRGTLVAHQKTMAIYWGMSISLTIQALFLAVGVIARLPAMVVAAGAFTLSGIAETVFLAARARRVQ